MIKKKAGSSFSESRSNYSEKYLEENFAIVAVHELRGLLQEIFQEITEIHHESYGKIPNQLTSPLRQLQRSAERAVQWVGHLPHLPDGIHNSEDWDIHEIDVERYISSLIEEFSHEIKRKGIEVSICIESCSLKTNTEILDQALVSLFSNAIDFTDSGEIGIDVRSLDQQAIAISIEDTGRGLSAEQQEEMRRFFQHDGMYSSPAIPGTGFALAKKAAGLLRGCLDVVTVQGRGSAFTLIIPQHKGITKQELYEHWQKKQYQILEDTKNSMQNRKIIIAKRSLDMLEASGFFRAELGKDTTLLFIGNDAKSHQLLRGYLQDEYNIIEGYSGNECLAIVRQHDIDLIILDLELPDMSGFELLETLKDIMSERRLPIVVFSEKRDPLTIARAYRFNATDYLVKPSSRDEVTARIRSHIKLRRRDLYLEQLVDERTRHLQEANRKLKEVHSQLLQSEKMASIGQLAAGVAHEINNPIGFINSNIDSLQTYTSDLLRLLNAYQAYEKTINISPEDLSNIRRIKHDIDLDFLCEDITTLIAETQEGMVRVKKIIGDLKEFSHVGGDNWQPTNIHQGIDSTLNLLRNVIKYKAKIVKEYGNLPDIECLPSQINQVFMNIFSNACDAIKEKGILTIRTGVRKHLVWIMISDTGEGISPEVISRIFDPFFTTKVVGKGTGLGLSLSYGIIKKHEGNIEVESVIDQGTTFTVWLPIRKKIST